MAYQANRNNNANNTQADSNEQAAPSWAEKKMEKKAQNRENTKELAKDAGTVALQGLGVPGPLAGMAADKIAKNPLVNKTLNKVSDKLHKNPIASKAINKVAQSPVKDAAMGAIGGKVGGANSPGGSGSNGVSPNETGKGTSPSGTSGGTGMPNFGKNSSFSKKSMIDSGDSEEQGQAKTTMDSIGNMVATIKKIPPWLWPVIGWALLIFMGIIILGALLSQFMPMFGVDNSFGQGGNSGIEYVASSKEEQDLYERIKKVEKEYTDRGASYESGYISGTFFIMNRHDKNFTFDDMTESEIRKISEMMFKESVVVITCEKEGADAKIVEGNKDEEPACPDGYTKNPDKTFVTYIYDEQSFKKELANYMKGKLTLENDQEANAIAEEVFDYIDKYKSLVSGNNSGNVVGNGNGSYWWPIGSMETTEANGHLFATGNPAAIVITSTYGGRVNPTTGVYQKAHGAIDIAGGMISTYGAGAVPVIASKDGIIESVVTGCFTHQGSAADSCGGGYGNHVIIKHSDGNYTLYAHMHQNTITVNVGDIVAQGQIIGKVGSSGNSTGAHLHFEVRVGQNNGQARQDPETFVDPKNPRPSAFGSQSLTEFINSFEGAGPASLDENSYVVYADSGGVLTVGYGIAIQYNLDRLSAVGIDGNSLHAGDLVPKILVDQVKQQVISAIYSDITSLLSREGITLENYQIDALVSRAYNMGNVVDFPENYKKYGNTQPLYDNYMSKPITDRAGNELAGLVKRRAAEWNLFHNGVYQNHS